VIDPRSFVEALDAEGVTFFTGVPDSLLKNLGTYVMAALPSERHVIAANEGNAVAIALGHYLGTGRPAAVYLQNSGIGNTINPILSLADADVYGVPMVLIVGWRGEPGVADEPQHITQGRVMTSMLDGMDIAWSVLPDDHESAQQCVRAAVTDAQNRMAPHVLLVRKGVFSDPDVAPLAPIHDGYPTREDALRTVIGAISADAAIVSTTGMLSRELFELRVAAGADGDRDFLTVGGMGHASSIALGVALGRPATDVWCLDGDGALLMHGGALAVIGTRSPANLRHVVFNNGVHDSVGGQPTAISAVDVPAWAMSCGYRFATRVNELRGITDAMEQLCQADGPGLLEVRVCPGSRGDLGRPTRSPAQSKSAYMNALGSA